jgi:hypothetical protein
MDLLETLVKDTLAFLKQEYQSSDKILATAEEVAFFEEEKVVQPKKVALEPVLQPASQDLDAMAAWVRAAAPELKLADRIPDDAEAKKIGSLWQEQLRALHVAVIAFGESGPALEFLSSVAKAIDTLITPAKMIEGVRFEKEKKWNLFFNSPSLKLVIAPGFSLWKGTQLAALYKEHPASSSHSLAGIPLLLLRSIPQLLKTPALKKELWKSIVSQLSS